MSAALCPCCGQPVPKDDLLIDLNTNTVTRWGITIKLSPQATEVLAILRSKQPRAIKALELFSGLWHDNEGDNAVNHISVLVHAIRHACDVVGVEISNIRGGGYHLLVRDEPVVCRLTRVPWKPEEDAVLHSSRSLSEASERLPHRTRSAVSIRASTINVGWTRKRVRRRRLQVAA